MFLKKYLILIFSLITLALPAVTWAAVKFEPRVTIPGSKFIYGQSVTLTPGTKSICDYVFAYYQYGIGIIGVLAAVMIAVGGLFWLVSMGNSGRIGKAKSFIMNGLLGVALALGSFLILATINKDLVVCKTVTLSQTPAQSYQAPKMIDSVPFIDNGSDAEGNNNSNLQAANNLGCAKAADLIDVAKSAGSANQTSVYLGAPFIGSDPSPKVKKSLSASLKTIIAKANQAGLDPQIISLYRSPQWQQTLFDQNPNPAQVCQPKNTPSGYGCNCPHVSGVAIDIKPGSGSDADYSALKKIFQDNGWFNYTPEKWHFSAVKLNSKYQ